MGIWILGEHCLVRGTHGALSFMSLAVHVIARGSLEYAVFRHHGHEGLDIMTVPGISERSEQLFQISICGRSAGWIVCGIGGHRSILIHGEGH